jgi:mono/diheme cytochrome c family protein/uncharacterized membrane protein
VKQIIDRFSLALLFWVCSAPLTVSGAETDQELAAKTLAVFSAKCAACHGPNLAKPKGRFGYVLDLARIAANPEMVVPYAPDESELWQLVSRNEMPPADAPAGPLSEEQKETIRRWIGVGTPALDLLSETERSPNPAASAPSAKRMVLRLLGPLHLVILHFPIALLIAAATTELRRTLRGAQSPTPEVRFCVMLAGIGAAATACLGWIHAANGYGLSAPKLLFLHRWTGTLAALVAVGAAILSEWDQRRGVRSILFRVCLFLASCLVAIEGHFGGMLVHGDDFLSSG